MFTTKRLKDPIKVNNIVDRQLVEFTFNNREQYIRVTYDLMMADGKIATQCTILIRKDIAFVEYGNIIFERKTVSQADVLSEFLPFIKDDTKNRDLIDQVEKKMDTLGIFP
jgi:hypothetical protein